MGYSKNKNGPMQSSNSVVNLIGRDTEIIGSLKSESDIRVDGKIQGKVSSKGKIVIGKSAVQEGDISCDIIDVVGTIKGNLYVKNKVVLQSTAKVLGDITTSQLIIEAGATFSGRCKMGGANENNTAIPHKQQLNKTEKEKQTS